MIELFDGNWLDPVAKILEKKVWIVAMVLRKIL